MRDPRGKERQWAVNRVFGVGMNTAKGWKAVAAHAGNRINSPRRKTPMPDENEVARVELNHENGNLWILEIAGCEANCGIGQYDEIQLRRKARRINRALSPLVQRAKIADELYKALKECSKFGVVMEGVSLKALESYAAIGDGKAGSENV
jgi:hypothetical protein